MPERREGPSREHWNYLPNDLKVDLREFDLDEATLGEWEQIEKLTGLDTSDIMAKLAQGKVSMTVSKAMAFVMLRRTWPNLRIDELDAKKVDIFALPDVAAEVPESEEDPTDGTDGSKSAP